MLRQEKTENVANIKKLFEEAEAYFITDYQGLNVADITVLRKNLRENKVKFLVAKNTLFRLAAKEAGQKELDEYFLGPTAVAFSSDDPSVAAKILYDSYKERELPRFKAFVVEDQIHGPDQIKALAELPPRDVLLSQLVSAVEAPLTELVGSIDGFFRELVGSIDALADKKKSAA
ncbi:MAG: 50S ribosomal protein L10 [Candidatus Zixiibacteriota bacterium]|nr:MAG: 50S ribosomal protein L10 [candidate division Zixibacteria bacterium]